MVFTPRNCGLPKRTSKTVLVLAPQDDFHETLRTHEKAKCWCGDLKNKTFCFDGFDNAAASTLDSPIAQKMVLLQSVSNVIGAHLEYLREN